MLTEAEAKPEWKFRYIGRGRCELCGRKDVPLVRIWRGNLAFNRCPKCLAALAALMRHATFIAVTEKGEKTLNPAEKLFKGTYQCEYCRRQGKTAFFGSKADLKLHIERVHRGIKNE